MARLPRGVPGALLVAAAVVGSALLFVPPAAANRGGPDAYGYIWVDSRQPPPTVSYSWVDISSSGTRLLLQDDQCTYEVSLGFQFRFYNTIQDNAIICANGFLAFGFPGNTLPTHIPSPDTPNNYVTALGMDLNPDPNTGGGGAVYFYSQTATTPKRFIVEWSGVYKYASTTPETFQIILEQNETAKDGRVLLQYQSLAGLPSPPPIVGIENATGSSGLEYTPPLANSLAVAFLPPSDATLPPDTLRVSAATLAPFSVQQGTSNQAMVRLDLSTVTNWVDVSSVRVVLSGVNAGATDVPHVRLWLDDGDGIFSPGNDIVLAATTFVGSPPLAILQPMNLVHVTTTATVGLFVSYDVAATAQVGDWIGARLPDTTYLSVAFPDVVSSVGFPIETYTANTRTRIDPSQDTLHLLQSRSLGPQNVTQWSTDVPAISLDFAADRNTVDIAGLRVELGGNATPADVWYVKAIQDVDGDGNFTAGTDVVLAVAPTTPAPPRAILRFNLTIPSSSEVKILILVDIAPDANLTHGLNLTMYAPDVLLPSGSADSVSGAGFPVVSGTRSILPGTRPRLDLPYASGGPDPNGVWMEGEYMLGPANTAALAQPAGNGVPGYLVAENNATTLFLAVDAPPDVTQETGDGLAIAFDTDLNGAPTDGADDVFLVNGTSGEHYRYNATSATWTLVGDCNETTAPACVPGFGATAFRRVPHRFYEIAIPLATLGASLGGTLGFAVAGPPYGGLSDAGNRSTWPLLYGVGMPNLAYFGLLGVAPGLLPNRPPTLNWTGEPGYVTDGLDPGTGFENTTFRYRVLYTDLDNDPPAVFNPLLHVIGNGTEIPTSPFPMVPENPRDLTYFDGRVYEYDLQLPCQGNYSYYFTARDARGLSANATPIQPGPTVICPDHPPILWGESVNPVIGTSGTTSFTYRIAYADPEGRPPAAITLTIHWGATEIPAPTLAQAGWAGTNGSYVSGAWYEGRTVLAEAGTNYTYEFHASDGNFTVQTDAILGPYVFRPPPDYVSVSGVDLAPLAVDQGVKDQPMLGVLLSTNTEVNVSRIRFDLIGDIPEEQVLAVYLYKDANDNRACDPGVDSLLDTRLPVGGAVTFYLAPLAVVRPWVSLLVCMDLSPTATADATVGFELHNESSLVVGSGDVVNQFVPYRSTRSYVNGAPAAAALTVDGYAVGAPGILHVGSATPSFAWRFTDPNAIDTAQIASNVTVSSGGIPLWSLNRTGTSTLATYAGTTVLLEGHTYLLTVSVFDGRLWSAPSNAYFRRNTPPPAPTLLAPTDLETNVDPNVTLLWNPSADADGDAITYTYWVSENPGFSPALSGTTPSPGVGPLSLQDGKTYYWKVGASDGFAFAGNATVWRFSTPGVGPPPTRGDIRGRVLNGTAPLPFAVVEILADGVPVAGALSGADGRFRVTDLDLRAFVVRVSAYGFAPTTRDATPTDVVPVVDLGDIALVAYQPPADNHNGGDGVVSASELPLAILVVLLVFALAMTVITLFLSVRRRRDDGEVPPKKKDKGRGKSRASGEPPSGDPPTAYVCPECGREVAADATVCDCGAVFDETADTPSSSKD